MFNTKSKFVTQTLSLFCTIKKNLINILLIISFQGK